MKQPVSDSDANLTPVNPHVSLADTLTLIVDVLRPVERRGVDVQQGVVEKHGVVCGGGVAAVSGVAAEWKTHALLPQVAHEELQTDEGEDAEAEHGEDHDV